ncbi:MAG: aminotransferase class I/II-fold pyridoxal phosphate-dependent enzyme [Alphaproteobacteria bacterium]|uniref:Aminotransferase n=1 Tax=Candidatus Nitrobium versatile TaxID=2884831 RepID=A0A953JC07_9BACT|nr:aminotransferase class I/II-fold pyridoxal phosphate-dependent enzyme [Candidatus Nitrobium versatile]
MFEFNRIKRLPPYVFAIVNTLKMEYRRKGEDIIDLGMGNPDMAAPKHVIDKLCEAAKNPKNHRYSASKGITHLRMAISEWYKRRFDVDIDPESEAVVTIGSKEGLSHLALATIQPGDVVMTPTPAYPIHPYSVIIAGGEITSIPIGPGIDFLAEMEEAYKKTWPRPKMLIINFPHNPTTTVVEGLDLFRKVVDFAKENNIIVIHDFAYADLIFDDYKAPSFLQVPGAKEVGVEFFSLTKSYSMAGWRVGFCVGNKDVINALIKIKSYLDYGMFQPIQIASIVALRGSQDCVEDFRQVYQSRRNALIKGLNRAGWAVESPKATMFVWAEIPEPFKKMGSLEFCKYLITEAKVAVSPGIGFGEGGDGYVRFALVENEHRIKQATAGIRKALHQ